MGSDSRHPGSLVLLFVHLMLSCLTHCSALTGQQCRRALITMRSNGTLEKQWMRSYQQPSTTSNKCDHHFCGDLPSTDDTFRSRSSQPCLELMDSYRSQWSKLGLTNIFPMSDRPCTYSKGASQATNPIIVSSSRTIPFVLCTIPKVACTNLRKLISPIINDQGLNATLSAYFFETVHWHAYPTLWHYEPLRPISADVPEDTDNAPTGPEVDVTLPSFIVGRNPYSRILSGFIDKMVTRGDGHDKYTYKKVNKWLSMPPSTAWEATPKSFRKFVRLLANAPDIMYADGHFKPSAYTCGGKSLKFDYYLRVEDMQEWFPCWMHGLGLREQTEGGWADTPHGRMRLGVGNHTLPKRVTGDTKGPPTVVTGDKCWWHPRGTTCQEYYDSFTLSNGDVVPGLPPSEEGQGEGRLAPAKDRHNTNAAAKWQEFYEQEEADIIYRLYYDDFVAWGYDRHVVE